MASPSTSNRLLHRKLLRDLGRQRAPFIAVAVTMLLGVALFGASFDAYRNLLGSYDRVFAETHFADIWIGGGDTAAIADRVAGVDGVSEVTTRVRVDVPMRVDGHKLAGRVLGLAGDPVVNDVYVTDGQRPQPDAAGAVLAEDHLAKEFGLHPGDTVEVLVGGSWTPLPVTGRAASAEFLWLARNRQELIAFPDEFGVVFAPDSVAQAITGTGPNQVLVRTSGRSTDAVLSDLEPIVHQLGATDVFTRAEQPSNAALSEDIQGFSQMAFLFPLLFLTAAGMAAYTLLSRRIRSERSVIGMLRAQGVARRTILRHYLGYGVIAGLGGAVPGIVLGLWLARVMTRFYVGFLSLPITAVSFHPETLVIGIAFGLVAGALAALGPARVAASIAPAEAMRGVVPASGGRRTLLERMVPFSSHLSASSRLVVRSISRNRRRTAMTMGGVALSLLLILVSWSMLDTIKGNLDDQYGTYDKSDAQVVFDGLATGADLDQLRAVDGVDLVEPSAIVPVSIQGPDGTYATILRGLPADTQLRTFHVTDGVSPTSGRRGLVVGAALRSQIGVALGDTVTVTATDEQGRTLATMDLPVVGFVQETLGTFAYTTLDGLAAELGTAAPPVNSALVRFAPGVDGSVMRDRIEALDHVAEYQATASIQQMVDDATALLVGFVTLMLVVGGVLAATMVFTTASVSISERSNEVATLRASGVATGRIARLITAENLIVTAFGVVPGLVLGVLGGRAMMSTYTTDQFSFAFIVEPRTLIASAGAVFLVAVLSQWPGLRAMRRLDLAATVRERSA